MTNMERELGKLEVRMEQIERDVNQLGDLVREIRSFITKALAVAVLVLLGVDKLPSAIKVLFS